MNTRRLWAGLLAIFAVVLLLDVGAGYLQGRWHSLNPFESQAVRAHVRLVSWGASLGFVVAVGWVVAWMADEPHPLRLVYGADARPSTSKLQFFAWTWVMILCFVAIVIARALVGDARPIEAIPPNLMIAMGMSALTVTAAKGLTVSQLASGTLTKTVAQAGTPGSGTTGLKGLVADDDGTTNLGKIQMLAWTAVALLVFLFRSVVVSGQIARQTSVADPLPDIDPVLMVLMGLSHGTYMGQKLVTTDMPRLTGLGAASGAPTAPIVLMGTSFGDAVAGGQILVDGAPIPFVPGSDGAWTDARISFALPPRRPDGSEWSPSPPIQIAVVVNGRTSNALAYTVARS